MRCMRTDALMSKMDGVLIREVGVDSGGRDSSHVKSP